MSEKSMDFDAIQRYWEQRAASDRSAQSTTNDVYLRAIEYSVVDAAVVNLQPKRVLDVGCGDARTTAQLAAQHRALSFTGFDYSEFNDRECKSGGRITRPDQPLPPRRRRDERSRR